jgi:hypothetical protein
MIDITYVARSLTGSTLIALGLLHLYWAGGGSLGKGAVIPQRGPEANSEPLFRPSRSATIAVAGALFAASAIVFTAWPPGNLALAGIFGLRAIGEFNRIGFFKRVRATRFAMWDTWLYSPLCLLLALGCLRGARR